MYCHMSELEDGTQRVPSFRLLRLFFILSDGKLPSAAVSRLSPGTALPTAFRRLANIPNLHSAKCARRTHKCSKQREAVNLP